MILDWIIKLFSVHLLQVLCYCCTRFHWFLPKESWETFDHLHDSQSVDRQTDIHTDSSSWYNAWLGIFKHIPYCPSTSILSILILRYFVIRAMTTGRIMCELLFLFQMVVPVRTVIFCKLASNYHRHYNIDRCNNYNMYSQYARVHSQVPLCNIQLALACYSY